ncbi:hypothetical protein PAL_GLEAN10008985 [Pteropus alecto]|uniref:Uncharacterized protein n=1 Tax=Pteropus alecto TaxID=9402 RepID=L5KM25_PTEAL|nr:hypothetical protein PAL_GLEAN10008985 [Pteropus alecto]
MSVEPILLPASQKSSRSVEFSNTTGKQRADRKSGKKRNIPCGFIASVSCLIASPLLRINYRQPPPPTQTSKSQQLSKVHPQATPWRLFLWRLEDSNPQRPFSPLNLANDFTLIFRCFADTDVLLL